VRTGNARRGRGEQRKGGGCDGQPGGFEGQLKRGGAGPNWEHRKMNPGRAGGRFYLRKMRKKIRPCAEDSDFCKRAEVSRAPGKSGNCEFPEHIGNSRKDHEAKTPGANVLTGSLPA